MIRKKRVLPRAKQRRYSKRSFPPRQRRFFFYRIFVCVLIIAVGVFQFGFNSSQEETTTSKRSSTKSEETVDKSSYPSATIVIDPGHGGYDSGSVGADDVTYEKDLTLEYALLIGEYLQELNPNLTIIYTRDSDEVSWPDNEDDDLKARVEFTNAQNADYFLSVHFNASEDTSMYGYSAYMREDDTVSRDIYTLIEENLQSESWSIDDGVGYTENYPLYVVSEQTLPALLFEVGYITNYTELMSLQRESNKKMICKAVAEAYHSYILEQ